MPLDPAIEQILAAMAAMGEVDFATAPVADLRAMMDNPMDPGIPPIQMARVKDIDMALPGRTLGARLYVPEGAEDVPPLTVYFHGGGWVLGTLDTHDRTCRGLAEAAGCALLSVDYRLAPEHPYPAAAVDAFDAVKWAADNAEKLGVDGARLAVAGDSAGGNLAAAAAIQARDAGGPAIRHQLLVYPVTDADFGRDSYLSLGDQGYLLTTIGMQRFWDLYMDGRDPADAPLAAVVRQDDLSNLPTATVLTAEYDPLKDEGAAYAKRLADIGVQVGLHDAPGMVHGFFSMFEMVPAARTWIDKSGAALRAAFAP